MWRLKTHKTAAHIVPELESGRWTAHIVPGLSLSLSLSLSLCLSFSFALSLIEYTYYQYTDNVDFF